MKQYIAYMMMLISTFTFVSCESLEDRLDIGGFITAEQLDVSVTPVVMDGKNTNRVILDNKSPVLSSWNYGVGKSQKKTDTILLVVEGENEIIFTGRNPDGSEITKTLTVNIDELYYEVPPEWAYLTNGSAKEWVWDDTQPAVWGNGGYMSDNGPAWWTVPIADIEGQAAGEGAGAKMVFTLSGAKFEKVRSDGTTETGTFNFNMKSKTVLDDGTVWAKGKLNLKGASVLCGISPNEGNAAVQEYDILILNGNQIVLSYPEPGAGPSGTAWFWMFKASD